MSTIIVDKNTLTQTIAFIQSKVREHNRITITIEDENDEDLIEVNEPAHVVRDYLASLMHD